MVAHAVGCGNSVYNQKVDVADEVGSGVSPARRFSARLRERSSVSKVSELSSEEEQVDHHHQKKYRTYRRREGKAPIVVAEMPVDEHVTETPPDDKEEILDGTGLMNQALHVVPEQVVAGEGNSACESERSDYAKVKETIRTFNKFFLHFVQQATIPLVCKILKLNTVLDTEPEEEKRCRKVEIDERRAKASKPKGQRAAKAVKPKIGGAPEMDTKRASKRPDLKAITKMKKTDLVLYPTKRIGCIPGIDVGYQFFSRAEMVAVGFHSHWLNGIDYMGQSYCNGENVRYTFPLAVAIVMSGQYEDDLDNCEDVVYTGQGGNNLLGNRRQVDNQVMQRGNLALKNSMDHSIPVRVVRGHKSASSYVGKVYTYDGLYAVVQNWAEQGVSGFTVYKFRLRRLEGQPILTTSQVEYFRGRAPNSILDIRGLVCKDISEGREDIPIPATNLVDDPPVGPTGFTYCKSVQVSNSVKLPTNVPGCACQGTCIDPRSCACAKLNGSEFPYVHRDGGRLIEAKAVVFECGPNCGCGPGCVNRISQRGLKYRLEVFRTPRKGWAVRSWDFIPSGAPVCEYTGVLMRTDELTADFDNNYIFDIDCLQTMKGLDGRERRLRDVSIPSSNHLEKPDGQKSECVPEFCIDAGSTGSIARFINHSCAPNLFVQCVLSSHHDIKLARVLLFAADNIPPMQELAYDYGYALDSVTGPDGKIKQLACHCGASDCRKRLF